MRWASTWSGPFCASSSITKIAISGQYLLWVTRLDDSSQGQVVAGHARPGRERARAGAGRVVFAQAHDHEARAALPVFSNSRNSRRNVSALSVSRARPAGRILGIP